VLREKTHPFPCGGQNLQPESKMSESMDIYLLIGQSNMAGRGSLDEVPSIRDPRLFMFRDQGWMPAEEPLDPDKTKNAGIGPAMSFAAELLNAGTAFIGLLPCAVGGTPLSRWMPGADLYQRAVATTRKAITHGALKGVLWHQGERDSKNAVHAASYGRRFRKMVYALRLEFNESRFPVLAGELGYFLEQQRDFTHFKTINRQLKELEQEIPDYACVSSDGLTDKGDHLHFDSRSQRELGRRYAQKYLTLVEKLL